MLPKPGEKSPLFGRNDNHWGCGREERVGRRVQNRRELPHCVRDDPSNKSSRRIADLKFQTEEGEDPRGWRAEARRYMEEGAIAIRFAARLPAGSGQVPPCPDEYDLGDDLALLTCCS